MKLHAAKASGFRSLPREIQGDMLLMGAVPVNDILFPLWENQHKIVLLYGSYGSGKSIFFADQLINHCLNDEYCRVYFGRKILDTVRGSVFQTIIDRIRELKKEHLFRFSDAPNGSMVITCKDNNNHMMPFGANDPTSLKSIKDPTHFFLEELDQFSFDDFGLIYSRLRTEKANTQLFGAFNTDRVFQSHWIRKMLFEGEFKDLSFKMRVNYVDNQFIDKEDYEKKLRLTAGGDMAKYNAIANGEWGMVRTGSELWKQFSETRDVSRVPLAQAAIHVSLDENVNPYVTVSIWQVVGFELRQVHEIKAVSPDNNAPKAAAAFVRWLNSIRYKNVVFMYGDPSASRRSTVDENSRSFFDKFAEVVEKSGFPIRSRVRKSHPAVALSVAFINEIYENNLGGWSIKINETCFTSIEDYVLVKENADGTMVKDKVKEKDTGISYEPFGHFSDAKRYFITSVLEKEFNIYKSRRRVGAVKIYE